jgi:hypothetical protein
MSRPLRLEYAGALYHVISRGDRREAIFEDDEDGYCEPVLNLTDPISFWTVYGHRKEGGVTALIDCANELSANVAAEILEQALSTLESQEELTSMLGRYGTVVATI